MEMNWEYNEKILGNLKKIRNLDEILSKNVKKIFKTFWENVQRSSFAKLVWNF